MNGSDDALLDFGPELRRPIVIPKRLFGFITAFSQDTFGWDVTRNVVRVCRDPETAGIIFLFQPKLVINDNFTGQKNERQLITEIPGLDNVGNGGGEFLAPIQTGEIFARVVSHDP